MIYNRIKLVTDIILLLHPSFQILKFPAFLKLLLIFSTGDQKKTYSVRSNGTATQIMDQNSLRVTACMNNLAWH